LQTGVPANVIFERPFELTSEPARLRKVDAGVEDEGPANVTFERPLELTSEPARLRKVNAGVEDGAPRT
jgi:hypothetical protein